MQVVIVYYLVHPDSGLSLCRCIGMLNALWLILPTVLVLSNYNGTGLVVREDIIQYSQAKFRAEKAMQCSPESH